MTHVTASGQATALGSVLLLLVLIGVMRVTLVRRLQDPFGIFLLGFGVFYVFRAVLISTGLDTPSPDYLFASGNVDALLTKTTLALCGFLVFFILAAMLVMQRKVSSSGLLFHSEELNVGRLVALSLGFTGVAVLVEFYLFAQFGSFGGVVHASKVDRALAGLFFLKTPCGVGALIALATYFELRARAPERRRIRFTMLACVILDSILVFSWGQRGILVIVAAMLILVSNRESGQKGQRARGGSMVRIVVASVIVIFLAVFLRDIRDGFTDPGGNHTFAQQSLVRRASQGLNGTYYDASMLGFRDWPQRFPLRDGVDFWNGFAGSVPSLIWPDKPSAGVGTWFRQIYQPQIVNGWPIGAPTVWYLNFGWLGIVIGGAFSGAVVAHIARRYDAAPWSGMNVLMAFSLLVFVVPLGWESQTPFTWIRSALPLIILMRVVVIRPKRNAPGQSPGADRHLGDKGGPIIAEQA